MVCEKLNTCDFVNCCSEFKKSIVAKGFIHMYCESEKMSECVRKNLSAKYGKEIVPKNMMPNGAALPSTSTSDWDEKALHYRKYL